MAQNISIKDRTEALKWLDVVKGINEDYKIAMKEAGETLVDMENFCEGTIVDDLVNYGHSMINAAEAIFNTIGTISETVNSVLDYVDNLKDNITSAFASTIKKIF